MYYNAFWIIKYFRNYKNIFYFAASYGSFEPSKPDFYLINNWRCVNLWSGLRSTVFRNRENLGCHLAFKRATSAKLGLFETVCQKWNGLAIKPFFCLFEFWRKKYILRPVLEKTYNILLVLITLTDSQKLLIFGLFSFLSIWPILKLLMAKFGLFHFFLHLATGP